MFFVGSSPSSQELSPIPKPLQSTVPFTPALTSSSGIKTETIRIEAIARLTGKSLL